MMIARRRSDPSLKLGARLGLVAATSFATFAPAALTAQDAADTPRLTVDRYLDWERVSDPQISPDGTRIVYTRSRVNQVEDRWDSDLWLMNADGTRKRFLVDGSSPRWSPDGTRILFSATSEPEGTQLFVRWMDEEGAVSQVTRVLETPMNAMWSPDGSMISFTMYTPGELPSDWSIDLPSAPEGASWTETPRIVENMHFRADRVGFTDPAYMHLFVVESNGGTARQLTSGKWHVGARFIAIYWGMGYDWTPDGRTIVFDGLMKEDSDLRYFESAINAVDVATGETREITSRKGLWTSPVVSPDGRTIAFTGYDWSPQTYHVGELYTMRTDGSGMRMVAPELDRDIGGIIWDDDGTRFYFAVQDRGSSNVYSATPGGVLERLTEGVQMLSLTSAGGGTAVGVRSAPQTPGDVVRYDLEAGAAPVQLTGVNADVMAGVALGDLEEIWYGSTEGAQVQGWIVKPPGFDPSERYPLILEIHGGPHGMYNVGFNWMFQNFAANDFVVLYTNPRGSTGYGTDFGNAIDDRYPGERDLADLLYGVDEVVGRGYIDTDRMYVGGCSGGGALSSWVIGHDDRFAAAAVRCPVINWMSFAGTADVAMWGYRRFRELPWENPDKWLRHSSLMYVGDVTTPTLLLTGELDLRTPMSQTEEYYQALKIEGVPAAIVRFNEEYHGTGSKPSNFMRTQLYMRKWYDRWVGKRPVSQ